MCLMWVCFPSMSYWYEFNKLLSKHKIVTVPAGIGIDYGGEGYITFGVFG